MNAHVPIPDELNAIRTQIKALKEREEAIKAVLLSDPTARTGNDWVAEIKQTTSHRCDVKELRANYPQIAEQFTFPRTDTSIVLHGLSEDGELISARKMRAAQGDAQ